MSPISIREFQTIANSYGLAQAEACAAGACTHAHGSERPGSGAEPPAVADLRCPDDMPKLLGRAVATARPDGVVVLACNNCARRYRAAGHECARVLHHFNLLGELITTEISPAGRSQV